ncbi:glycoside hydrolase family 5 protein [Aaosphaeria arxii CBS 175.79]|uniref:Glycoside hydrolase family 5 protein n=1 Tax=Aaosphaeria arxii CBS 175.79 TaxID=1450172 RepID=A0A6A5XXD5_9PLEO|nr:glycoside hydrolase family 5 protein [Aaosphaeria arxii CBS 175.79]KAF2016934.1 glycoside hydrolase family 5 protein [Aaosphaeria arxii CBS 175.79]
MYLRTLLAAILGAASWADHVAADLRITKDLHSWGGVNFPGLQFLPPKKRDEVIRQIVKSNARVIRLHIRPYDKPFYPDPELEPGTFARGMLDVYDDTLAAIHRISKGQVKVIISPHDAHALRKTNDVPCDSYCEKLDGAFLDFYSNVEYRDQYKTRLEVLFKQYPSKNFDERPWSTLNEVILGVDVQNQPWSGIYPIVSGESWLCDVATHLKDDLELGQNNIAVIAAGVSGPQTIDEDQNFPDTVFDCNAIDAIGIHGYFQQEEDATAGTPWANLFLPGNTLTARAEKENKLLFVEEMAFTNTKLGLHYKKQAIWDQGAALNLRGIPWLYSHLSMPEKGEGTTSRVDILRDPKISALGALQDILKRAYTSRSNSDWSTYISPPLQGLTNNTLLPLNPYVPEQSACTFGCLGWLCDSADGCEPDLLCKNSICTKPADSQPGNAGATCNSKAVCQEHLRCEDGLCQPCISRVVKQPDDMRKTANVHDDFSYCFPDTHDPFLMRNICLKPQPFGSSLRRGNPCANAMHCDANEFCDWGLCKPCKEGCLGMKCKSSNKCKTGYCNMYGRCDYPGKKKKIHGPGAWAGKTRPEPKGKGLGQQGKGGANKVWDVPMKVNIPKESVKATGAPVPT